MDYMTFNQLSSAFKNISKGGTQTYRKPNIVQLGATPMQQPATISLDKMYGGGVSLPQAQSVQYWQPQAPTTQQPTTGIQNTESYLESTGLWKKYRDRWDNETWMPNAHEDGTPLTGGDVYEQSSGTKWVWNDTAGTWLLLKRVTDPDTSVVYWTYSDEQPYVANDTIENLGLTDKPVEYEDIGAVPEAPSVGGYPEFWRSIKAWTDNPDLWGQTWNGLIGNYAQQITSFVNGAWQYRGEFQNIISALSNPNSGDIQTSINELGVLANKIRDTGDDPYKVADSLDWMAENLSHMVYERDFIEKHPGITSEEEWIQSNDNRPTEGYQEGYRGLDRITAWQTQLEDLMKGVQNGDIDYINDNGLLDTTALRNSDNIWGNWMADVLEQSYDTGVMGDFYTVDTEGNVQFSPDVQTLIQHYNDTLTPEQDRYMKQMRLTALQNGRSVYDPYYSNAMSDYISDRSAEVANNVSQLMNKEMQDQYSYIMNSFKSVLTEAAGATQAEEFASAMNNQWADILSNYQMGLEELAQMAAEQDAAASGQTWAAIIGFISNFIGAII